MRVVQLYLEWISREQVVIYFTSQKDKKSHWEVDALDDIEPRTLNECSPPFLASLAKRRMPKKQRPLVVDVYFLCCSEQIHESNENFNLKTLLV